MPTKWKTKIRSKTHTVSSTEATLGYSPEEIQVGGSKGIVRIAWMCVYFSADFAKISLGYRRQYGESTFFNVSLYEDYVTGGGFGLVSKSFTPYVEISDVYSFRSLVMGDLVTNDTFVFHVQWKYQEGY